MDEYSRILIEEYCATHKSKKSKWLKELVEMSYDIECEGTDADLLFLEKTIEQEKNPVLRKALEELYDFLFCC